MVSSGRGLDARSRDGDYLSQLPARAGMEVGPTGPADLRPAPVAVIPSESIIPGTLG